MLAQHGKKKVPILMYHSISHSTNRKFKQFTISPSLFAEHMAYLYQHAYTPITVTQFVNALSQGNSALPERTVVLTFDDGFADFFTEALPVFKQYGFVATLYVVTACINGTSCWLKREGEATRPMLTWDQLTEISAYGIECGAHSQHHAQLDILSHSAAQDEIVQSKRLLEQHLGREVSSFAYPYGYHTTTLRQQIREAGYTSACVVKHKLGSEKSDPFALARLTVRADTSVDALASLLTKPSPSLVSIMYTFVRALAWQLARYSSASVKRYLNGGLIAR
ncbi:MAG: polysaccharide deacetylase family protein [Ktedonobacteraceae bacterium]